MKLLIQGFNRAREIVAAGRRFEVSKDIKDGLKIHKSNGRMHHRAQSPLESLNIYRLLEFRYFAKNFIGRNHLKQFWREIESIP